VIFLCDGYLAFKSAESTDPQERKNVAFLRIMVQLPMDLQEVMCNRIVGKAGDLIEAAMKERGFDDLGECGIFLLQFISE